MCVGHCFKKVSQPRLYGPKGPSKRRQNCPGRGTQRYGRVVTGDIGKDWSDCFRKEKWSGKEVRGGKGGYGVR